MFRVWLVLVWSLGIAGVLAADQPATTWNFKSAKASDAVRKYQAARMKLDEAHEKSRNENRDTLIGKLQAQVKAATQANNLDEALAIRDAIKILQSADVKEEAPIEKVNAQAPAGKDGSEKSDEPRVVYLVSFNFPKRMIGDDMTLTAERENGGFFIRPGFSGAGTVSLESAGHPGSYLLVPKGMSQRGLNPLMIEKVEDDANQKRRASFKMRPGVAHKAGVSIESFSMPGYYIRHREFRFQITPLGFTAEDRQCATFRVSEIPPSE